jgi:uncharacterized C2H2 Zn-finger protein
MAQRLLIVEHPSLRDINQTISKKTYEIEYNQDEEFRSVKKQIEARDADPDNFFVDPRDERLYKKKLDYINLLKEQRDYYQDFIQDRSYILGPVYAGSGYERKGKRMDRRDDSLVLDWALIEVPEERLGDNRVRFYFFPEIMTAKLTKWTYSHFPTRQPNRMRISISGLLAIPWMIKLTRKLDVPRASPPDCIRVLRKRISTRSSIRIVESGKNVRHGNVFYSNIRVRRWRNQGTLGHWYMILWPEKLWGCSSQNQRLMATFFSLQF